MTCSRTSGVILLAGSDESYLEEVGNRLIGGRECAEVDVVDSAAAADEAIDSRPVEAIVCTDVVGDVDAIDFLEGVLERDASLVTALITDEELADIAPVALDAGVTEYVPRFDDLERYDSLANRLHGLLDNPDSRAGDASTRRLGDAATRRPNGVSTRRSGDTTARGPDDASTPRFDGNRLEDTSSDPDGDTSSVSGRETSSDSGRSESSDTNKDTSADPNKDTSADPNGRRRPREASRDSDYRELFEKAADGIFLHDPETGVILDANPRACEMTGFSLEELVGSTVERFTADEADFTAATARDRITMAAEAEPQSFEWKNRRKDGTPFWSEISLKRTTIGGQERVLAIARDVTERKHAERTYRETFENVADGLVVHDPETGEILDVNEQFCEMNGYTRDDLLGENVGIVTAGDEYSFEKARRLVDQADREGAQLFEWQNEHRDGTQFPVEVHLAVVRVGGEERVLASVRDITERKRREREYEQIFDGVNDAISVHDPETGEILDVNESYEIQFGYDSEDILELGVEGLSVTEEGYTDERSREIIRRVAETGESEAIEWRVETANGERRWFEVNVTPAILNGTQRVLGISRDVTERKRNEVRLRRSERQFRQIAEAVDEVIHLSSPDLSETHYLTPAYEDIWGRPIEEMYEDPTSFLSTIHPEDREEFRTWLDGVVSDLTAPGTDERDVYEYDYRIRRDDGGVRWIDGRLYPIHDDDGTVIRFATVNRDVTEQRRREETLESFHDATQRLTEAGTPADAAALSVEAATSVLEFSLVGVYLYDDTEGRLAVAATSPELDDLAPPSEFVPGDCGWQTFVAGEADRRSGEDACALGDGSESTAELLLPLGRHGVLLVGTTAERGFETDDVEAAQILAARLEAGLNHVEGEREIAKRERELEAETNRADRLARLNTVIRDIEQALVDESTREGVESTICDRLTAVDAYDLAWIGEQTVGGDSITVRNRSGEDGRHGAPVDVVIDETTVETHPAWRALETGSPRVVDSLVEDRSQGAWRRRALDRGYQSCCAVPLEYDGVSHGVLTVYADEPGAFEDRERRVLEELARSIGYAITTIERKRSLESDATVELEFDVRDEGVYVVDLARRTGGVVEHERAVRRADGGVSLYCTLSETTRDPVEQLASNRTERDVTIVTERDGAWILEVSVDDWIGSLFAEFGAVVASARASSENGSVTVTLSREVQVRTVVERFRRTYPETELAAKREIEARDRTLTDVRDLFRRQLTDRQLEVVETAYHAGYFEWPRESSGVDVADLLGITQPTFNRHLRLAEDRTFALLLDDD